MTDNPLLVPPAGQVAGDRPWHDGRRTAVLITRWLPPAEPAADAWYGQLRAFDAAGWATHVVVIRDDPALDRTVAEQRGEHALPAATTVHCFGRRDRRVRASWWRPHVAGHAVAPKVADWLDWLTSGLPGAVVIVHEPEAYEYLSAMGNPVVARVAVVTTDPSLWPSGADPADLDVELYEDGDGIDIDGRDGPAPPTDRLAGVDLVVATSKTLATQLPPASLGRTEVLPLPSSPDSAGDTEPLTAWLDLTAGLADSRWDRESPTLLLESLSTEQRVLRWTGILAGSSGDLTSWICTLPGLMEPAGTIEPAAEESPGEGLDEDRAPHEGPTTGPTREVEVRLRSNAMAYVASRNGPFTLEFGDPPSPLGVYSLPFADRMIASRGGLATMTRQPGGTVEISPLAGVVVASDVDGRQVAQVAGGPTTTVTHALRWSLDIDWASFEPGRDGARFTGTFRASRIAPGDPPPSLCIVDVTGRFRPVGLLTYSAPPEIKGTSWRRPVAGILLTDRLVATTELAGSSLALLLGVQGGSAPIGELRTRGRRSPIRLSCRRGRVTLLPAPDDQMIVTPGRGHVVRAARFAERRLRRGDGEPHHG